MIPNPLPATKRHGHGLATCAIVPADPAVVLDVKPGEIRDLGDRAELVMVCE